MEVGQIRLLLRVILISNLKSVQSLKNRKDLSLLDFPEGKVNLLRRSSALPQLSAFFQGKHLILVKIYQILYIYGTRKGKTENGNKSVKYLDFKVFRYKF